MAIKSLAHVFAAATLLGSAMGATMVPGPFNATAYSGLMDCVKNADSRYHVAIHDGEVLIIPAEGQSINLNDAAHHALGECLDKFSPHVHMAVMNGRSAVASGAATQPQELATVEWAESNGAQGKRELAGERIMSRDAERVPLGSSLVSRAPKQYFYSHGSPDNKNCEHYDQKTAHTNSCTSYGSPYKSIRFSNLNPHNSLRVEYWPHHLCARDYKPPGKDGKTISIPGGKDSACIKQDVFSYRGSVA